MWPPWLRSPSHSRNTPPPSPSRTTAHRSISFSCSSFKDIQSLCQDQPEPQPAAPRSPSLFRRVRISTAVLRALGSRSSVPSNSIAPPGSSDQSIVVYYTSLRVVRRTFEDCRAVRSILRGFRVSIDERDVSMDDRFLHELQGILGRKNVTLPRVFVGGMYIGGAEDVKQLHESGELRRLIERLPRSDPNACDRCGGLRFLVCDECSGSHKVYMEKSGFRSCTSCNVNGLIRCPSCSYLLPRHTK
ncbi:Thioredoxin-like fold [Senna tora]|uniref:Thioredoxin-like fold n=1 Tax=Senna tora TaxID=362788 RepID=A0A834TFN6_9FABA|nr:Thioredoxin-like fold [Senna tora]